MADRVPPGSDLLAGHDSTIDQVDYRRVRRRHAPRGAPTAATVYRYGKWRDRFQEWARSQGYQSDLTLGLSDRIALEYVNFLKQDVAASDVDPGRNRYTPNAIKQALAALQFWAEKLALDPMPSFRDAWASLHHYVSVLANPELEGGPIIVSRSDWRVLPSVSREDGAR